MKELSQPKYVFHADWGTVPRKRWLARAKRGADGRYTAYPPNLLENHADFISSIRRLLKADECAFVGFDFPIGIPAAYARLAGFTEFKSFLLALGDGKWSDFRRVARTASEISIWRPFYPFAPGNKRQAHLLTALGLDSIQQLRRECEKQQTGRRQHARCSGRSVRARSEREQSWGGGKCWLPLCGTTKRFSSGCSTVGSANCFDPAPS